MAFLLSVLGVLMVVWALFFLLTHRRSRPTSPVNAGRKEAGPVTVSPPQGPWTRGDRIAFASLVVGGVLGVLGLLAR